MKCQLSPSVNNVMQCTDVPTLWLTFETWHVLFRYYERKPKSGATQFYKKLLNIFKMFQLERGVSLINSTQHMNLSSKYFHIFSLILKF